MLRVGERLALIEAGGGGVLVDLEGGAFFRVNASALRACAALVRGAGVRELVEAGVAEVVAAAEVAAVEAALASAPPPGHARSPVVMRARADGWELYAAGRARLAIARGRLRALGATAGNADAVAVLVWAAPHLLALVGIDVLHASANLAAGAAHVWSGLSGAGKTTFARALATAGAPVLAEDVVVLRGDAVLADGERQMRA